MRPFLAVLAVGCLVAACGSGAEVDEANAQQSKQAMEGDGCGDLWDASVRAYDDWADCSERYGNSNCGLAHGEYRNAVWNWENRCCNQSPCKYKNGESDLCN